MHDVNKGFALSNRVDRFQPDELPRGKVVRLLVRLVSDALGRPMRVPMLVARGERPGPVFGVTSAIHGNEINGIPVIHRLMDRLDLKRLRGTVAAVMVVNVPGYLRHQREFSDGVDLNHVMPGRAAGNESQVYAARLLDRIVCHFDALIDLHTASFGRVNSLYVRADMSQPETARMAVLQRPQIILHNPPSDTTLRGAAGELGIPALTVEVGDPQRFQREFIKRTLTGIRAVLVERKMLPKRKLTLGPSPIVCAESEWMYTEHGGLLEVFPKLTDAVEKGEIIARLTNVFGDVLREYRAPRNGVIIGKSTNPIGQAGARVVHLGRVATPDDGLVTVAEGES
jgi:predicted deacylase